MEKIIPYLIWIPVLIIISLISSKLTILNQAGNNKAAFIMWVLSLLPVWIIVSRYSKNILFDAMLYDVLIVFIYAIGLIYFGHKILSPLNYIGVGLVLLGLTFIKI